MGRGAPKSLKRPIPLHRGNAGGKKIPIEGRIPDPVLPALTNAAARIGFPIDGR